MRQQRGPWCALIKDGHNTPASDATETGTTSNDWLKASNVQLCHYSSPEAPTTTYHIIQIKTNHFLITLSHHNAHCQTRQHICQYSTI